MQEENKQEVAEVKQGVECKRLLSNVHCMLEILSFMNRKKKSKLRQLSRTFGKNVALKSMVSLRFVG